MKKNAAKKAASPSASPKKAVKKGAVKKPITASLNQDGSVASPNEVRDDLDPGDETQRRFRYQYAYGVILLVNSVSGKLPYKSIWCEHHDDFLAQLNGVYDSFQIKTRKPEIGPWELTTEGFVAAIKKFTQLEQRFPGRIQRYKFVSNTRTSDSTAEAKIARSPDHLIAELSTASSVTDIQNSFQAPFKQLAESCEADHDCLFKVLQRVDLVLGPGLDDFEAALSSVHLPTLGHCSAMIPAQINAVRDELIQRVYDASSNRVDDPSKHWCCVNGAVSSDPRLQAKHLLISLVDEVVQQRTPIPFRFSPVATITDQRITQNDLNTFEKKLIRGGLQQQMETMRRRTISTEQHLLELAARKPQEIRTIRNQLEVFVQGACDDASLQASGSGSVSGQDMLRKLQDRLEKVADNQPEMVCHQQYDCLMGMAGLLTEACKVWWSPQFNLQEETP